MMLTPTLLTSVLRKSAGLNADAALGAEAPKEDTSFLGQITGLVSFRKLAQALTIDGGHLNAETAEEAHA